MKTMVVALALLCCTAASAAEDCRAEQNAYRRAVDSLDAAQKALADYDGSALAPVVPGQAEKDRRQLQQNVDAARAEVTRSSALEDDCLRKRLCKKRKPGWHCTIAWSYDECCLDGKEETSRGKGP